MEQERTFSSLKALGLNSVIATASWEIVEKEEGKYDFTEVDYCIRSARENGLKLIFIWFGAFKNPFMTYAPNWVKTDPKRFPRAMDEQGRELELPSIFNDRLLRADASAYCALLEHIKETDFDHTVVMMQIENEPGIRGTARDYSPLAQKAWKRPVPARLITYLQQNENTLKPDLKSAWTAAGRKTSGNWEEIFGASLTSDDGTHPILNLTEHLFTAYHYARYLDFLSSEGKRIYPIPTFTNASVFGIDSRGISLGNGCSIPDFFDMYKAGAPSLDILTPNSYMQQLDEICKAFCFEGNPILIPESSISGARAIYAIGEWDAIAFSPFGIDSWARMAEGSPAYSLLKETYNTLSEMEGMIAGHLGSPTMRGTYLYNGHAADTLTVGNYQVSFSQGRSFDIGALMAPATGTGPQGSGWEDRFEGGALLIQTSPDEFFLAGYGVNASFDLLPTVKHAFCGYDSIYEGVFQDGTFIPGRLLNGDERNAFLPNGKVTVLRIRLYHY